MKIKNNKFIKGIIFILVGIVGLVLPILPGIIFIALGINVLIKKNENRTNTSPPL